MYRLCLANSGSSKLSGHRVRPARSTGAENEDNEAGSRERRFLKFAFRIVYAIKRDQRIFRAL